MLILAARNIWRRKGTTSLAVCGVALGCALMTVLLSLSLGLSSRLANTASGLAGKMVVSSRNAVFGGLFFNTGTPLPGQDLAVVRQIPHVRSAYGRVSGSVRPAGDPLLILPLTGYTEEEIKAGTAGPFHSISQGRAPSDDREIIIGGRLAQSLLLAGQKIVVGHTYNFVVPSRRTTRVFPLRVTGIFSTGDELTDVSMAGLDSLAREVTGLAAGRFSSFSVQADAMDQVLPLQKEIGLRLAKVGPGVQVVVPRNILDPLTGTLALIRRFLLGVSLLSAVVSAFFIAIIMSVSVLVRMKEFAVLKAVGWPGRQTVNLVLLESLLVSLLGAALGVAGGYEAMTLARYYLGPGLGTVNGELVGAVVVAGIGIGSLGGLYPAWRARQITPAEIFRRG